MAHSTDTDGKSHGAFTRFVHSEVAGSVVLLACTIAALVWANSSWADAYFDLAHTKLGLKWADSSFALSVHHWVNDFVMVLFFFVVGLEIKREVAVGELASLRKAVLPVSAAVGGMVVPAAVYAVLNFGTVAASGWGIPMATDIAFALGVLALFGKRVPVALKVFLTALAIADDLGAVLVIAVFYTEQVRWSALLAAVVFLVLIVIAARIGLRRSGIYILLALGVWMAVFVSGVHATVAGVLVALVVPIRATIEPGKFLASTRRRLAELEDAELTQDSMVGDRAQLAAIEDIHDASSKMLPAGLWLEQHLHPVQAWLVLPLFAFFNAGVRLGGGSDASTEGAVGIGIVAGLFLGKQVGVTLFSWVAVKAGWADLPDGVRWGQIYGLACLAGIGFTMSLFIGELAFSDAALIDRAKLGILVASLLSGVWGMLVLARSLPRAGAD